MADISIDEARAQQWILDVRNELALVEQVLEKVSKACTTTPAETDDILKEISKTGEDLNSYWNKMCSGFNKATSNIENAIKTIGKNANDVMSDINSVRSKIGH